MDGANIKIIKPEFGRIAACILTIYAEPGGINQTLIKTMTFFSVLFTSGVIRIKCPITCCIIDHFNTDNFGRMIGAGVISMEKFVQLGSGLSEEAYAVIAST